MPANNEIYPPHSKSPTEIDLNIDLHSHNGSNSDY